MSVSSRKEGKARGFKAMMSPCDALNPMILSAAFLVKPSKESKVKAFATTVPLICPFF
jgi:hypothetical protein